MKQCIVQLSKNSGKAVNCLTDEEGNSGLGLNESGITWNEADAPVRLEIAHDELQIVRTDANVEAVIERKGRKFNLKMGKSIRVLTKDEIRIGASRFSVRQIFSGTSEKVKSALRSLRGAGAAAMFVMAASLVLPVMGCDSEDVQEPEPGTARYEDPCDGKTGVDLQTCCLNLTDDSERTECCERLESEGSGLLCNEVPEVLGGDIKMPACMDKSGEALKACCDALDEDDPERADCCERLESEGSGLACVVIPEKTGGVAAPPLCWDKSGADLKACCDALDEDDPERADCCERLESEGSGLGCDK